MAVTLQKVATELGLFTILHAPRDVHVIFLTRFLRMLAYGGVSLILAMYFSALGFTDVRIGLFMTLTLLGDVLISLLLTLTADGIGRRRTLLIGSGSMLLSGAVFALGSNYWLLLIAAVIGVISVSGNEIGPFRAVEESTLAGLAGEEGRADVFAWYVVVGTFGSAMGLTGAGWIVEGLKKQVGWEELDAYRVLFWLYALIGLVKGALTFFLSPHCEVHGYQPVEGRSSAPEPADQSERDGFLAADRVLEDGDGDGQPLPPASSAPTPPPKKSKIGLGQLFARTQDRKDFTLLKLCLLFAVDSLASGMVPYSLINFYVDRKFHMPKSTVGNIMSATWIMSSIGNIFASAISKRIGLVKTMVFSHLPSAIFLMLLPTPRVVWLTVVILIGRGTLASMDQAPRSAFLSKVIQAEERTAVMGIVNVVKTLSQSSGPTFTGMLAGENRFWVAFVVAGALKSLYDLGMLAMFLRLEKEVGQSPARDSIRLQEEATRADLGDEFDFTDDEDYRTEETGKAQRQSSGI
ncbi:hypothetical protein VMCG_10356 [Cytospora schulzeri]|uniref:Major facilitator superfamily (MFS) profile domain-containing protein n=1 Tax=Cytospora schulzeri TaxID=448051 RepID=A0A423VFR7_9PEZI|nr:hypothetical protein VMCG_10356 [Valsa malicola]